MDKIKSVIKKLVKEVLDEQPLYENFMGAQKTNGFSISINNDKDKININISSDGQITESTDDEYIPEHKGGIITFSTEINAIKLSKNSMVNWIKQKGYSLIQKYCKSKILNKIAKKHEEVYEFSIGNFVKGNYKAKNGDIYSEDSLSIEIIGINSEILKKVAKDIKIEFKQESVLVKDYNHNKIYFLS